MSIQENVAAAVEGIQASFPGYQIETAEDGQGGVYVVVSGIDLGPSFVPPLTWIGQGVTYAYPDADVYPHWMAPEVALAATGGLPEGVTAGHVMPAFDRPALQISRRSNRWNPEVDTAAIKLLKVIEWLRAQG